MNVKFGELNELKCPKCSVAETGYLHLRSVEVSSKGEELDLRAKFKCELHDGPEMALLICQSKGQTHIEWSTA